MKKVLSLILALVICISLSACGSPKDTALEHIPNYATSAFMLKFDKNYNFSGSCDEVPNSGIIVLYETSSDVYVVICKSSGKEIRKLENSTVLKKAMDVSPTGSHLPAQGDLNFITGCMKSCLSAAKNGVGGEITTNEWYVFSPDELPS